MAEKIIPDLADPVRSTESSTAGESARRWHFALSLFAGSMFYSVFHKAILPFLLGYLGTSRPEYAHVSYGVFWVIIAGYTVHKEQEITSRVQVFMGTAIGFALWELCLVFLEDKRGWLVFSHLLAAIPLLASTLNLLKFAERRDWKIIGAGTLLYGITEGMLWLLPR